jgi:cyclopropane fatty-acyl-phospholipid synthase-like methyltransferase
MNWTENTAAYYGKLLEKHGAVPASIDASREGQRLRFSILLDAIIPSGMNGIGRPSSLLDVGCGYGAFVEYLIAHGHFDAADGYTGIDISPEMIAAAREMRPNRRFEVRNLIEEPFDKQFEAVIACGIFQLDHGGEYVDSMIEAMWRATGRVLAFNMLSAYTPEKTPGEAYFEPGRIMTYCQQMTPFVSVNHSYRRNDFTVTMLREQT